MWGFIIGLVLGGSTGYLLASVFLIARIEQLEEQNRLLGRKPQHRWRDDR